VNIHAQDIVAGSMVDLARYDTELVDGTLRTLGGDLTARLVDLVADGAGLAVCHGSAAVLARHGLDVHRPEDAAVARDHLESVFRAFAAAVDVALHSPVPMDYDRVAGMDVDGFNKNTHFTPNSDHTTTREFLTTKCVHFDAATPFIGNIYGPNTNISGGLPIICDTRDFCAARGVDPADLVELMPHSYNVAVKERYSDAVLADYSVALDVDLEHDLVMVVLDNEVSGGLAHAGSMPRLTRPGRPGTRPIRHLEFQFPDTANLQRWYRHYGLAVPDVTLKVPDGAARERYHRGVESALPVQGPAGGTA